MKHFTLSTVFFLISTILFAQKQVLFQETKRELYHIGYNDPSPSQNITDKMIRLIGEGNNATMTASEWEIEFDQEVRAKKMSPYKLEVSGTMGPLRIYGNYMYKGFRIKKILYPETMNLSMQVLNRGGAVIHSFPVNSLALEKNNSFSFKTFVTDSTGNFEGYKIRLLDKVMNYTHKRLSQLRERVGLINQYYATDVKIHQMQDQLRSINLQDIDNIIAQDQMVVGILREIDETVKSTCFQSLGISPNVDPLRLLPELNQLHIEAEAAHHSVENVIRDLPMLFYDRGLSKAREGFLPEARRDFESSVSINPLFSPAHLEIARMDFYAGSTQSAAGRMLSIYRDQNPPAELRTVMDGFSREIAMAHVNQGRNLHLKGQFQDAINVYYEGLKYCEGAGIVSPRELGKEIVISRKAIFEDILSQTDQLINGEKFDQANVMLEKTRDFVRDFPELSSTSQSIDALESRIFTGRHRVALRQGKVEMDRKDFRNALVFFKTAGDIEQAFPVERDPGLGDRISLCAKSLVLQLISSGKTAAQMNRLNDSRGFFDEARSLTGKYGLTEDSEILDGMSQVEGAIANQECINSEKEYFRIVEIGEGKLKERDFVGASTKLSEALTIASQSPSCGIRTNDVLARLQEIGPAAEYQNLYQDSEKKVEMTNYSSAIKIYLKAGQFFEDNNIEAFGFDHSPLVQHIREHPIRRFTVYGAQYFTDRKENANAISLLRVVAKSNYPKNYYKSTMIQLGSQMAIADSRRSMKADPKALVVHYDNGLKRLKVFRKTFIKQYKKLTK